MYATNNPVEKRKRKLLVLIPFSTISTAPSLREKTIIVGRIARALAIFRVDEVILYKDPFMHNKNDERIFIDILEYLRIPPYLRKKIVPIKNTLKYVGILNPLQIVATHIASRKVAEGEIRAGLVLSASKHQLVLDIGLENEITVRIDNDLWKILKAGDIVLVKITKVNPIRVSILINHNYYIGYKVKVTNNLKEYLEQLKANKILLIATSRYGQYVGNVEHQLRKDYQKSKGIALIFGSPRKGLLEIFPKLGIELNNVNYVINLVIDQGVRTIRTEEALIIALAIIDYITKGG